jgi:type 1 glutamine amidotransferase
MLEDYSFQFQGSFHANHEQDNALNICRLGCRSVCILVLICFAPFHSSFAQAPSSQPAFHLLAFYSESVERDHVMFAHDAIRFFGALAIRDHFEFTSTTDWSQLNDDNLRKYEVVVWLNDQPTDPQQRLAFEHYMKRGGGWMGFHVTAYNDRDTGWPWFVDFLGGTVFLGNNWPPLPATVNVDDSKHPVTAGIPSSFVAPSNEWYIWDPSPRLNRDVKVLMTLSPANYPIGLKDTIQSGDVPIVWIQTRYRMIYMNMGHGDKIFTSEIQNHLFENAVLWLGSASSNPLP